MHSNKTRYDMQNVRDAAKNVLKWTSKTAGVVSSSDLGSGQETLEYFVQVRGPSEWPIRILSGNGADCFHIL